MRRRRHHLTFTAGVFLALTTAACGTDDQPGAMARGGRSATDRTAERGMGNAVDDPTVEIKGFAFRPATLTVEPGSTIRVTNSDDAPHTLTADDRSVDTGNLTAGQSMTVTVPEKTGAIKYRCDIHQYMTGTIQVSV